MSEQTIKIIGLLIRFICYIGLTNFISIAVFCLVWAPLERDMPKYIVMRPRLNTAIAIIFVIASFVLVIYLGLPYWNALLQDGTVIVARWPQFR